jgi:methionine biosynthesis protein MetW
MDPNKFYKNLWNDKKKDGFEAMKGRDWFHRFILDPMFYPTANPRSDVALKLLVNRGERLLDIGCWDGRLLEKIRDTALYNELRGVDIVEAGVDLARKKGFNAQVVDLNAGVIPFPDQYFDAVTMLAVLEHVFDPYSIIREVRRVLRPGGTFIIDVPNVASVTNRARILLGRIPVTSHDIGWDGGHLHYFTKHALDHFLQSEGFEVLDRRTTGGSPHLREWWISLLGGELIYLCKRR